MDALNLTLLALLAGFAALAVLIKDLVRSAISLAIMSVVLAVLLFRLDSPYAAAFELSVVAGLVTVLFVSAIALTRVEDAVAGRRRSLIVFFLVLAVLGLLDAFVMKAIFHSTAAGAGGSQAGFGTTMWGTRTFDLIGQIAAILAGVTGVLALLRREPGRPEESTDDRDERKNS
jgi:NADH-quinone oxidoreductase subunit J